MERTNYQGSRQGNRPNTIQRHLTTSMKRRSMNQRGIEEQYLMNQHPVRQQGVGAQ